MLTEVLTTDPQKQAPIWLDLSHPTREELEVLAKEYHLHPQVLADCTQPFHLPKYEKFENATFVLVRVYDDSCPSTDDSVQAMTKKMALFIGNRFLLSVHRSEIPFLNNIIAKYKNIQSECFLQVILLEILLQAIETYHTPLEQIELQLHEYERHVFRDQGDVKSWEEIFTTKTRLMVIKRMLWHTQNVVQKFVPSSDLHRPAYQDLLERIENLQFFTDSMLDSLNNLLNVQISLSSKSTNDVMRILTVFSVIFMPLNFIVGFYGMNLPSLPFANHFMGLGIVGALLLMSAAATYGLFKIKGWLK